MKILYVPIDERPCNVDVIKRIVDTVEDITLLLPSEKDFGNKKTPANQTKIWDFILAHASDAEALILSVDMLIYGGLIPSRLHYLENKHVATWIHRLKTLNKTYPQLKIYASNMIMRTPRYSSSDEEPDYYETWGEEIFLQAYLKDKQTHESLSSEEMQQLTEIKEQLPADVVQDYEKRRNFNHQVNLQMLELAKEGVFTLLVFPQDDSAEFGYTAIDQKQVMMKLEAERLYQKVLIYPGADEVGATLLARIYNDMNEQKPNIYPIWSSTLGPTIVPLYEDRPFQESMISHIYAAGCKLVDNPEEADMILAYNTPGKYMQEAWEQDKRNNTYTSHRNLLVFVKKMKEYIEQGKQIIVADSAYSNGGDREFIKLMDELQILDQLASYKAWNTNCNTLGTTISQGVLSLHGKTEKTKENVLYHILEDYFYQSIIRMEMTEDYLPTYQLNYFDLRDKADIVNAEKNKRLMRYYKDEIKYSFSTTAVTKLETYAPWNRMFETGLVLETIQK